MHRLSRNDFNPFTFVVISNLICNIFIFLPKCKGIFLSFFPFDDIPERIYFVTIFSFIRYWCIDSSIWSCNSYLFFNIFVWLLLRSYHGRVSLKSCQQPEKPQLLMESVLIFPKSTYYFLSLTKANHNFLFFFAYLFNPYQCTY